MILCRSAVRALLRDLNPFGGSEDACAFAQLVRDRMGQLAKTHSLQKTRLFFDGPLALAVLLGQQLTSAGEIQLFEYQDPGYLPSCSLRT